MRIQHNIMAMNAYRNLGMNNSKLSKNLEKLSSGYRINRAGDDAAGLAISEKMRAQIAGLDQAQKNAQSGINLVQTAEGALTEVHDMLNRMTTLATQAANGTYSESDREKIQSEINALTEEIDRIADNSNFNGTKLLDGSLAADGTTKASTAFDSITGALSAGINDVDAVNAKSTISDVALTTTPGTWENGSTIKMTFSMSDGTSHEIELTAQVKDDKSTDFVDADGNVVHNVAANATAVATVADDAVSAALVKALNAGDLSQTYEAAVAGTTGFTLTHLAGGAEGANITSVDISVNKADGTSLLSTTAIGGALVANTTSVPNSQVEGKNATQSIDLSNATIYDGTNELEDCAFEIGGEKFVFYDGSGLDNAGKAAALEAMAKAGVNFVSATTVNNAAVTSMAALITKETGLEATAGQNNAGDFDAGTTGTEIQIASSSSNTKANGGMDLQIGSSSVETITVAVDSMKAEALGIQGLDVGDEAKANKAIDTINAAIEKVSVQRGNLGAIQNRLEHTINNLGVMEENIQDAEANIRDTDIADEMMAYTKNNILIQSAQAMLAQANQAPQGVLQLMQ